MAIDAATPLVEALFAHQPGETVAVAVQRGDRRLTLSVTLAERPPAT